MISKILLYKQNFFSFESMSQRFKIKKCFIYCISETETRYQNKLRKRHLNFSFEVCNEKNNREVCLHSLGIFAEYFSVTGSLRKIVGGVLYFDACAVALPRFCHAFLKSAIGHTLLSLFLSALRNTVLTRQYVQNGKIHKRTFSVTFIRRFPTSEHSHSFYPHSLNSEGLFCPACRKIP